MKRILIPSLVLASLVLGVPKHSFAQQVPQCYLYVDAGQVEVTFGVPTVTSTSINLNAPTAGKIKNISSGQLSPSLSVNWSSGNGVFLPQNARSFFVDSLTAGQAKPPSSPSNLSFTGLTPNTAYNFYFFNTSTGSQCEVFKITTLGQSMVTNPNTNTQTNTVTQPLQNQTNTNTNTQTQPTSPTPTPTPEAVPYKPALLTNPLKSEYNTIPKIITAVIENILIPLALPFLVIAFIWSGFLFVSARGNQEKLKKAKEAFGWTIAGAAVILASFVIARAIQSTIEQVRGTAQIEVVHEERIARND